MGDERESGNRSGGVNITGGNVTVGGDVVGRDKIEISHDQVTEIFRPLTEVVRAAPSVQSEAAARKVEELKVEVAKGKGANDGVVAKLIDGIVGLVPSAVTAVAGAFGTPLLSGIAGPVTKFVLDKIQGK